jgi:C-terminal processing protease CtpA/Prc
MTTISGFDIFYPDKEATQRIGVQPDIYIDPTIEGIREGRDELIEKAIEIIKEGF